MIDVDGLSGFPGEVAKQESGEHGRVGADHGPLALVKVDGVHKIHPNVAGEVRDLARHMVNVNGLVPLSFRLICSGEWTYNELGHLVHELSVLDVLVFIQGLLEKVIDFI